MAKCKYKYKSKIFKNKKCPHEALPGSDYCIWHKQEDGKDFSGQYIKETDLIEAYLVKANLRGTTFKKGICLWFADLQGANLIDANLQGVDLWGANLQGTKLSYVDLRAAYLLKANLQRANLWGANLQGARLTDTDFTNASFNEGTDLRGAFLYTAKIKDAKGLQYSKISKKCIEEVIADRLDELAKKGLEKELLEPECKNLGFSENEFTHFMINKNILISDGIRLWMIFRSDNKVSTSEKFRIKRTLYKEAKDIYVSLKSYFKNVGFYEESGTFFIAEFRVRGKIYKVNGNISAYLLGSKIKNFFKKLAFWKWRKSKKTITNGNKGTPVGNVKKTEDENAAYLFGSMLKNYFNFSMNRLIYYISSYGESISKVLLTALLIIFVYAGIYSLSGGIIAKSSSQPIHNFFTSLYFSIVTFTTLGYGDLHPVSSIVMRLLAGSEAFLGAFILAYFVVVVSRKIMR